MDKFLIEGDTIDVLDQISSLKKNDWKLQKVSVYFNNANFLLTKYRPLSNGVHLIVEMKNKTEIHIESANCGYYGAGPAMTVEVLEYFGLQLKREEIEKMIFFNDAVCFQVENGNMLYKTIDYSYIFFPTIRYSEKEKKFCNMIKEDRNVSVDLVNREVVFYNPQRTCWKGFLNLLSYMDEITMEYYIGDDNPLESGLYIGKGFDSELRRGVDRPDIRGLEHVNLLLEGSNFRLLCLIDRSLEVEVIESVYLALTGKSLFANNRFETFHARKYRFKNLLLVWTNSKREIQDRIAIPKMQPEKDRRR